MALEKTIESKVTDDRTISTEICLEPLVSYEFSIYDAFGDGVCCFEGSGSYSVSVNNTVIKKGGEFENSDMLMFELSQKCTADSDCDNNDPSMADECMSVVSACIHCNKECDEHGQIVFLDVSGGCM